jgi:hypothetical protein
MNCSTKKLGLSVLLLLVIAFPLLAADLDFKVGGLNVTLPGPAANFDEVGDRLRTTLFELLAPSTNRLVSAYAPTKTLEELNGGKAAGGLDLYAMVEVPRQAEYADCSPELFQTVLKGVEPAFGKLEVVNVETELNLRLKSRGTKPIEVGHPEMLGAIFQKTDAAGFAMLLAFKQGDHDVTMAGATAFVRVKRRILFLYLYRIYESPETVSTLRKEVEAWADTILSKNTD